MKYESGHSELPVMLILSVVFIFIVVVVALVIVAAKILKWLF